MPQAWRRNIGVRQQIAGRRGMRADAGAREPERARAGMHGRRPVGPNDEQLPIGAERGRGERGLERCLRAHPAAPAGRGCADPGPDR